MTEKDLREVNLLLSKAFTHARCQDGYRDGRVPLCREEFLQLYFAANTSGCFVIEKAYKIIAFCFTHLWGAVGWFGPLCVDPLEEGKGYGKRMVMAAVENLKSLGAKTIGLETSANSAKNLAFYAQLGFVPQCITVDLIKEVSDESGNSGTDEFQTIMYNELSPDKQSQFLKRARNFWQELEPGLDYTKEIELSDKFGFGDGCLIVRSHRVVGFIFGHTQAYSQEEERQFIKINLLQMEPRAPVQRLDVFINKIEKWARSENLSGIYLRAPCRYHKAFGYLLTSGFRVVQNDLRLTLRGYEQYDDPDTTNFSKWE